MSSLNNRSQVYEEGKRLNLHDALLYWLQMKVVATQREGDRAAQETLSFFEVVLTEDHSLSNVHISTVDDDMYYVEYEQEGDVKSQRFPRELVEKLLDDINSNPKYN